MAVGTAGLPALGGAAVILIIVQGSRMVAAAVGRRRREAIGATDARVRLTGEVVRHRTLCVLQLVLQLIFFNL